MLLKPTPILRLKRKESAPESSRKLRISTQVPADNPGFIIVDRWLLSIALAKEHLHRSYIAATSHINRRRAEGLGCSTEFRHKARLSASDRAVQGDAALRALQTDVAFLSRLQAAGFTKRICILNAHPQCSSSMLILHVHPPCAAAVYVRHGVRVDAFPRAVHWHEHPCKHSCRYRHESLDASFMKRW